MSPIIIVHLPNKKKVEEVQLKLDFCYKQQFPLCFKCGVLQELVILLNLG